MAKIGLIGYGKMGQMIHQIALSRGHEISAIIDLAHPQATAKEITQTTLQNCEVVIDFTQPHTVLDNVRQIAQLKKNLVLGTTGWQEHFDEIREIVHSAEIGFIWSSNFSLSVQLLFKITRFAAKLINQYPDFDIALSEAHHRHKLDAPSGTAITLSDIILQEVQRKKRILTENPTGKIDPADLHVSAIRVGEVPGTHMVTIDSESDTLEIKNTSRSRKGFALGAVITAEFIASKKGFYEFSEII